MSDYEDAVESGEDSSPNLPSKSSVRHRPTPLPLWDPDDLSLSEELPGFNEVKELLEEDDGSGLDEEEDGVGCPLPSTPVEQTLLETEIKEVLKAGVLSDEIDLGVFTQNAAGSAEEFMRKVWEDSWTVVNFKALPPWLQDNDYLHSGHRPPLPSYYACFKSIFRIHTETGNIWTHLLGYGVFAPQTKNLKKRLKMNLGTVRVGVGATCIDGCVFFIGMLPTYLVMRLSAELDFQEILVIGAFFLGAIVCLGFSCVYHTVYCHSECVSKLFSKLDYCGIAILIMGSFVPWLYYAFYCQLQAKLIYLTVVVVLGITSIVVSLWDRFSLPQYRPMRAGVFMIFGLSGIVPAVHHAVSEGWFKSITQASLGWVILMGCLYIAGALFYALRVPERFFPGKCDIWFQSHQIFHVLVLAAALVHYHGISEMASYRVMVGDCTRQNAAPMVF